MSKLTLHQWRTIIEAIAACIIAILSALTLSQCTLSLSVAKNNNNATQKTEQTTQTSAKVDTLSNNFKLR